MDDHKVSSATVEPVSAMKDTAGACSCKAEVNAMLAEHNTKLMENFLNERDIFIETAKLDERKRGKRKYMFASFCPFCGSEIR